MYINPFVFGVLTTLFVEMALYIGVQVFTSAAYTYKSKFNTTNNAKRRSQGGNYNG